MGFGKESHLLNPEPIMKNDGMYNALFIIILV